MDCTQIPSGQAAMTGNIQNWISSFPRWSPPSRIIPAIPGNKNHRQMATKSAWDYKTTFILEWQRLAGPDQQQES